jgi:hypothetical protein
MILLGAEIANQSAERRVYTFTALGAVTRQLRPSGRTEANHRQRLQPGGRPN